MELALPKLGRLQEATRALLRFRPYSGRLWVDIILILFVGALHHTVLPSVTRSLVLIDLMTPWIVTTLVVAPLPVGATLALLGAVVLETHSAAPAGLYLCSYWVILAVLHLTRSTLSWRHAFPWLVTLVVSQVWVMSFETLVLLIGDSALTGRYVFAQIFRLLLGTLCGWWLCQPFMLSGAYEETT